MLITEFFNKVVALKKEQGDVSMAVLWISLLVVSLIVYGILMGRVFPRKFLKRGYAITATTDRGVKMVKETNGRTIVYQPSMRNRKYISQYILSDRDGQKKIICKIAEDVKYIDFDILMFNGRKKPFAAKNVKQLVVNNQLDEICLPEEVAYVCLLVNQANDVKFNVQLLDAIPGGKIASYVLLSALTTILMILVAKTCYAFALGGVFRYSFLVDPFGLIVTGIFAGIALIIQTICILCLTSKTKIKKKSNIGEV